MTDLDRVPFIFEADEMVHYDECGFRHVIGRVLWHWWIFMLYRGFDGVLTFTVLTPSA